MKSANHYAHIQLPRYRNINDFFAQTDRLHGTETFMGDLNAETLVLGQDFCHAGYIEDRLKAAPRVNPFYHGTEVKINERLCGLLSPYLPKVSIDGVFARSCGAFSALVKLPMLG